MSVNAIETTPDEGFDVGLIEGLHRPWWNSAWEEFGAAFRLAEKLPPLPQYRDAVAGERDFQGLILDDLRVSWYKSIPAQLRQISEDRKRPPAKLSSKPVAVKSIWGTYDNRNRAFPMTVFIHLLFVLLIFSIRTGPAATLNSGSVTLIVPVDISPYLAKLLKDGQSGGGGGGGDQSPLPQTRGKLPRFKLEQLTPPTPVLRNPDPELAVDPSVIVPPEMQQQIDIAMFGDPLGHVGPPSAGTGRGGGIGRGRGGGVGGGSGAGVGPGSGGGIGGGVFRVGGGVSAPRLTRKIEPEYSEEARKAKYQGTVVLAVEVWPDGLAHNIRVIRSLGLGLDEKALEAVRQWQFVPGKKDGKAVKVQASIEVNFRLL
jgi:protein TonB